MIGGTKPNMGDRLILALSLGQKLIRICKTKTSKIQLDLLQPSWFLLAHAVTYEMGKCHQKQRFSK